MLKIDSTNDFFFVVRYDKYIEFLDYNGSVQGDCLFRRRVSNPRKVTKVGSSANIKGTNDSGSSGVDTSLSNNGIISCAPSPSPTEANRDPPTSCKVNHECDRGLIGDN